MTDSKLIEMSIEHLHDQIKTMNSSVQKLAENQATMNEILIRNTVVVEEHHKRSNTLERWVEELETRLGSFNTAVNSVDSDVRKVESDLGPIKIHVEKVAKIVNFIDGVPIVLKVVGTLITIVSALYGIFVFIHSLMPKV